MEINISENLVCPPPGLIEVITYLFTLQHQPQSVCTVRRGEITKVFKSPSGRIIIMTPSSDCSGKNSCWEGFQGKRNSKMLSGVICVSWEVSACLILMWGHCDKTFCKQLSSYPTCTNILTTEEVNTGITGEIALLLE